MKLFSRTLDRTDDHDPARAEHERKVREARINKARQNTAWTEIPETRLVPRGRWLVDAERDDVYSVYRGHVWAPGRAQYGYFQPTARLAFYVDEIQDVAFLEPHGSTWSQVVARKAAR